jgi:hypothetical protein
LSCQPQPESPAPDAFSSTNVVADAVPMRHVAAPLAVTLSENCTYAESFS